MNSGSGVTADRTQYRYQTAAALWSFALGASLILNIQPVGDGMWFWYGRLFREHKKLYTDLHLPLQPLFVLLTAWTQSLFGVSWLGSKILAVVQLAILCWGLWLLAGRTAWKDWQRGALLGGTFVMLVTAGYFRFDDYHVTGYCCVAFSLYLLLTLSEETRRGPALALCGGLGVLVGLSLANRLNDGAALLAGSGLGVLLLARRARWPGLGLMLAGAAATMLAVVLATGDTLRAWWFESILYAAAIKGGTGNLITRPLHTLRYQLGVSLSDPEKRTMGLFAVATVWLVVAMVRSHGRRRQVFAAVLLCVATPYGLWQGWWGRVNVGIGLYLVFGLIALAGWALVRLIGRRTDRREVLLAIPFLLLLAGIVTGGTEVHETYPPIAFALLLLPVVATPVFRQPWQRIALAALCCMCMVCGTLAKIEHPYYWGHFGNRRMFSRRTWYQHPVYGRVYIEKDQLALFKQVCSTSAGDANRGGMLSITNPYANWFCNVPPWHDYVQTWYDTTSRATIERLVEDLKTQPPAWVVYQRSPDTLGANELAFGGGKPLAHRALDSLIMDRIANGNWSLAYREPLHGDDWMVIRTTNNPPTSLAHGTSP